MQLALLSAVSTSTMQLALLSAVSTSTMQLALLSAVSMQLALSMERRTGFC
jgi:hypothetical protein